MSATPAVSVVAAVVNPRVTMRRWLAALAAQRTQTDAEILIAASEADAADVRLDEASRARLIVVPGDPLVPALWAAALAQARAPIVAITITACSPEPDWLQAIVSAHASADAAIGGTIDVSARAGLIDRAVHLVRYSAYLPPQRGGPVSEIAGDNGTYKRAAFTGWMDVISRDGFWESEFHRHLHERGERPRLDPAIRVTHAESYSAARFSRLRFDHGKLFGRARAQGQPASVRAMRVLFAPAVPPMMLARSIQAVASRGRLDWRVVAAAPLGLWFFACWAAGEAAGHLAPPAQR